MKGVAVFFIIPLKAAIKIRKLNMSEYFYNLQVLKQGGAYDEVFNTTFK